MGCDGILGVGDLCNKPFTVFHRFFAFTAFLTIEEWYCCLACAIAERYILYCKLEIVFHTEEWVRRNFLSALRHAFFYFLRSGVNQGLDSLTVLVVKGACLFGKLESVVLYW